ncbi:hypothetical protein GO730_05660 [Spirosoma sp. HMF3257]|uniref:Uncharacterized protein n=1 Tax=Spirosoma telluris TaxID=2183553 RepID=A0A327NFF8_9BACT|nr:hypothetical protein [Spirosoma telluris]RAI73962.1 hypothetical protein HMF3257_05620 [Spirosoma telluris]
MDFIRNARQVELDLIKGDWAIKREVVYVAQLSKQETTIKQLTGDVASLTKTNEKLSADLTDTKQKFGQQALKTKQARLEIWAMRVAVVLYIAGKVKNIIP